MPDPLIVRPPRHWAGLSVQERVEAVKDGGMQAFRADQISRHYFERYEADPCVWTDLPAIHREGAKELFPPLLTTVTERVADAGKTVKRLYRLHDGVLVETVAMSYRRPGGTRVTLCVSSQAGCGIGCPFCATGQAGLQRNLSAGEIIEQVRLGLAGTGDTDGLTNVVFMGMGEPLANYGALITSLRAICTPIPTGFGISARNITVSTAGMVPRIADLAAEGMPVTLAVSLHAPDDELRNHLVPLNRRWPVDVLLDAAKAYFDLTGRRVSIEYAMMRDINDQGFRAEMLARQLQRRGRGWVHVNLIGLNPTPGSKWTASRKKDEAEFLARLEGHHIPVTVRDTRGREVDGACGQLAGAVKAATAAEGRRGATQGGQGE